MHVLSRHYGAAGKRRIAGGGGTNSQELHH
jgi:hypothetical protein